MSGQNIIGASSIAPTIIVSRQLTTTDTVIYTVPAASSVKVSHGTICNITASLAPVLNAGTTLSGITSPTITLGTTASSGGTFAAGTYYWKVTALTAGFGETAASNEVSATLVANGTQVINWTAITNATSYKIYRGTAAGAENTLVATVGAVATYTDTGATGTAVSAPTTDASATYYWVVTAKNGNGESLGSVEVSKTVSATQTEPLSWPAVPTAWSYNVYRGTTSGGENVLLGNTTSLGFTDIGAAGTSATPPSASSFASDINIYLSLIPYGGSPDYTHRVINKYTLLANDTLSLKDYISGAMLGPGDMIAGWSNYTNSVAVVISGTVHS